MKKMNKYVAAMRADTKNRIRLAKHDANATAGVKDKAEAREQLATVTQEIDELQFRLYAEAKTALLVVFQAMDTGGKDGVIRKVFGPLNPQGVQVASFKRPNSVEESHDYLWRIHRRVPAKGMIGVFNRSHYEDILVPRVHKLLPRKTIDARYEQINAFEQYLTESNTVVLKFFLHISKEEQKKRLQSRLDDATRRWKFEPGDLKERTYWDKYEEAFQSILDSCSFAHAPWYVIPADNKWYRDWAVAKILHHTLRQIKPKFPNEKEGLEGLTVE